MRRCKPCGVDHPPAYFSRVGRCIGRVGHVRLCEHCVIDWDTVIKYGRRIADLHLPEPGRVRLVLYRDQSHLLEHLRGQPERVGGGEADEAGYYPSVTMVESKQTAVRLVME